MKFSSKLLLLTTSLSTLLSNLASAGGLGPVVAQMPLQVATPAAVQSNSSLMIGANGCLSSDDTFGLFGSYATPVGDQDAYLQLDAQIGAGGDAGAHGDLTAQVYRRIDGSGLYGVFAGYQASEHGARENGVRLGGVAELYAHQMTFSGKLGWDLANEEALGEARITGYLGDNTKLYGGYAYDGAGYGFVGAEHMLSPRMSVFAEAMAHDSGESGKLGVKIHFGGTPGATGAAERTLISRDREEFIPLWMQPCAIEPEAAAETTETTVTTVTTTAAPGTVPPPPPDQTTPLPWAP